MRTLFWDLWTIFFLMAFGFTTATLIWKYKTWKRKVKKTAAQSVPSSIDSSMISYGIEPWEVKRAKNLKGDNRNYLVAAHEALYSTYIIDEEAAKYRGVAIRAINDMAEAIGLDYVRTD